ncbi:MAG: hypothetical protein NVS4B6_16030 [Mycobacterium sp.]
MTVGFDPRSAEIRFAIGDRVCEGSHVGNVIDVGTVLIQVRTDDGALRVTCPWELARIPV